MATEGGGKFKQKRSHSSSKPYQRRKSLLGKVTDTVKDLLAPSWLTDFVSTVSKKTPPKDRRDAILEEEEDVFTSPAQSPSQLNSLPRRHGPPQESDRRPVQLPAPVSHTIPAPPLENTAVPSTSMAPQQQPTFSSSHLPFSKFTSQKQKLTNDDTMSERSDISRSTSGCSSLIPHPDKQAYQREILQLNDSALEMLKTDFQTTHMFQAKKATCVQQQKPATSSEQPPVVNKLFDTSPNPPKTWTADISRQGRPLAPAVREKPAFNTSLFGSPVLNQSSSILGGSFGESSFYCGKTTYGGASAYRKLNQTAPYQTALPIRKQLKLKPHNTSVNAVTSSTARRILETLERMSTPLSDAKKIPANESFLTDSVLSFTPGSYRRRPSRTSFGVGTSRRSFEVPSKGPPTSQLKTPSIASISKNRQKILASTPTTSRISESKTSLSRDSHEDENSEHEDDDVIEIDLSRGGAGKGGKMKREKSYRSRPGRDEDDLEVDAPSLKTDFTLPMASMPSFNFNAMSGKAKTAAAAGTKPSELKFTFSSPIQKSGPQAQSTVETTQGFKFSSPIKITEKEFVPKMTVDKFTANQNMFKPVVNSAPLSKLGNGGIGVTFKNQESSTDPAFKPASILKKGSVMDVLGEGAFKPSSGLKQGSVMDVLGKDNLVSGGAGLMKSGSVMDVLGKDSSKSGTFGAASSLKSGSVMDVLGNSSIDSNSLSAEKPSSSLVQGSVMDVLGKKEDKSPKASGDVDLLAKFKKPPGNWDCDTCLVQNKAEASKCVACGTSKPHSGPQLPPPASTPSLPAAADGDLLSKFKKPAGSWDCETCLIQNKAESVKCVACGSKKPGADTQPQAAAPSLSSVSSDQPSLTSVFKVAAGSWNCDVCMVQNKADDVKCAACTTPKPGAKVEEEKKEKMGTSGFKIKGSFAVPPNSTGSGFSLGKTSGVGFSFGSLDSKSASTETPSGFKIGSGFSFTTSSPGSATKPSQETAAGDSAKSDTSSTNKQTSSISGGFQFGQKPTEVKPVQVSQNSASNGDTFNSSFNKSNTGNSDMKTCGFVLGGQSSEASKTNESSVTSGTDTLKGGFSFGQKTDSASDTKSENVFASSASLTSKSGFEFGSIGSTPAAASGFAFPTGAVSKPDSTKTETPAPVTSGFTFGQQDKAKSTATETKPSTNSLFSFGQPVGGADMSKPLGIGFSANTDAIAAKRGRDEETDAPSAKKTFNFGQSSAATPSAGGFNFGASTSVTSASSGFQFGSAGTQENKPSIPSTFSFGSSATTAASTTTASTATPVFTFGASKPSSTSSTPFPFSAQGSTGTASVFPFGGNSSGTQPGFTFGTTPTTAAPAAAPFGSTNSLTQPVFGNTTNNNPPSGSVFGNAVNSNPQPGSQGNAMFGNPGNSSAQPAAPGNSVFGNSAPAFGASTNSAPVPAFGSANQTPNAGGFGFKPTTSTGAMNSTGGFNFAGTGGVFQFSAKGNEANAGAPAQGSANPGFVFGATQQPQPAATAPSFNSNNTFNFPGNTGGFTIGAGATESGRKIKRAVRKIRK